MGNYGRFGPLLGVIYIGNTYCKFLVYAAKNAEVLTFHEIKLRQISFNPGWLEIDPILIWKSVLECIEVASKNLVILDINPMDIIALGLCNQRGTTILWNHETGIPLSNAIDWSDIRTSTTLNTILNRVKGRKNYLKSVCGLPLSTCFSALKIKWLYDNVPTCHESMQNRNCFFGTLDTWIIWNLTGGIDDGIHMTDVTNASYTMLMNLQTQQWDRKLCKFFNVPDHILPTIKSCSEIYGFIHDGPLRGVPIASCMGDQPAALLGQMCTKIGQCTCTVDDNCFILFNTGQEIIDSDNGLLSTVAYKLGAKDKTYYALEGAIANAGASISWLQDKLQISTEINQNENSVEFLTNFLGDMSLNTSGCSMIKLQNNGIASSGGTSGIGINGSGINSRCGAGEGYQSVGGKNSVDSNFPNRRGEVLFIPAFNGLYSPYWKHDARGMIFGITSTTTAENVTQAAYEATGFQIREVLNSFTKDTPTWEPQTKLIVGGEFSENNKFMQFMADIIGIILERPQTTSPSCLGVMLAAGIAMGVLSLENARQMYAPPSDIFYPATTPNRREILYCRWQYAVNKCLNFDNFDNFYEDISIFSQKEKDPNLPVRKSIPGTLFFTTSFVLLLVAKLLYNRNVC